MRECPDCGHSHPDTESCVCPEAPFYAVCCCQKFDEEPNKRVFFAVPCSDRVEREVVYKYMREVMGTNWWMSCVPFGQPGIVILAIDMLDVAWERAKEKKYLSKIHRQIKDLEDFQVRVYGHVLPNLIEEREARQKESAKKRKKKGVKRTPVSRSR